VQGGAEDPGVALRVAHDGESGLGQRVINDEYVHAINLPGFSKINCGWAA
jgi:hypothetical protein